MRCQQTVLACLAFFAFVKGNITKASLSLSAICVTPFGLAAFLR
jgi:hypothetical protein